MASKIPVHRNAVSTKAKESFLKVFRFSTFSLKSGFSAGFGRLSAKAIRRAAAQKKMYAPRLRAAPLFSFACCAFSESFGAVFCASNVELAVNRQACFCRRKILNRSRIEDQEPHIF